MTREELEAVIRRHGVRRAVDVQAILLAADEYATAQRAAASRFAARAIHAKFLAGIEDYLFIGGDRMPARQAAGRLGVSTRTIVRYRAYLRRDEASQEIAA